MSHEQDEWRAFAIPPRPVNLIKNPQVQDGTSYAKEPAFLMEVAYWERWVTNRRTPVSFWLGKCEGAQPWRTFYFSPTYENFMDPNHIISKPDKEANLDPQREENMEVKVQVSPTTLYRRRTWWIASYYST
ncbi:hypothetical protein HHI36_016766 [Cryptolaemus montrouzieri]|uniref:Uncharacterized protein n=1 Tax=Cryptolaemus montrouzieri TaxID=559131 RepID=A0ABD2NKR8_9CUCU